MVRRGPETPSRTARYAPALTPGSGALPKKLNTCPSHAVIVASGNTPAGVVPSPLRRSTSGRTPLRPTRAVIAAPHTQPAAVRSASCRVAVVASATGESTTTIWVVPGWVASTAAATRPQSSAGGSVVVAARVVAAATVVGLVTGPVVAARPVVEAAATDVVGAAAPWSALEHAVSAMAAITGANPVRMTRSLSGGPSNSACRPTARADIAQRAKRSH